MDCLLYQCVIRLLFEGGVYFFGIYKKYKKLVNKTKKRTTISEYNKKYRAGMTLNGLKAAVNFELFDSRCFATKRYTWQFQSISAHSSPCDFTRRLSPVPQKVPHFAWHHSWNVADYHFSIFGAAQCRRQGGGRATGAVCPGPPVWGGLQCEGASSVKGPLV